ncbi:nucleolar protein 12 [Lampris incognitus]|uniref:nucleolar protein 12 n=1 Tax=Lampris incognitus TaxID=2546036 RepID=UPI0024B50A6A|nr:nucleolar protein 12 [Lampris incognitus]
MKNHNNASKKGKLKPGSQKRKNKCIVMFDDKNRQEFLTGFHKRKVERRKAAVVEIQKKIKEEQKRVREQRHKEYMKMFKERTEALEEDEDDLEDVITGTTESVQFDHPNHTVTVTTISDLDFTKTSLLGPAERQGKEDGNEEEEGQEEKKGVEEKRCAIPKRAGNPILNKKIRSLTASLSNYTKQRKRKGKQEGRGERGQPTHRRPAVTENKNRLGRTTKKHRRRQTGKRVHHQD